MSYISSSISASAASPPTFDQVKSFRVVALDTDMAGTFSLTIARFDAGEDVNDPSTLEAMDSRTMVRGLHENVKVLLDVVPPQWQNRIPVADSLFPRTKS